MIYLYPYKTYVKVNLDSIFINSNPKNFSYIKELMNKYIFDILKRI